MLDKAKLQSIYKSPNDLIKKIDSVKGKTFSCFDVNNRLLVSNNKGALGHVVEEGIFGYSINSNPSADFDYLGLELKTTGLTCNKVIRAKERLTLESINYFSVINSDFYNSKLWMKNKGLFIVFYFYLKNMKYGDMPIAGSTIHYFSESDLRIIEDDYNKILSKIKDGKAETISESDTLYLGACTAGKDKYDVVKQPFSSILAKRRKFCLKQSYLNQIVKSLYGNTSSESLVTYDELKTKTFETILQNNVSAFIGMTESQIRIKFGIKTNSKSKFEIYISKMLGLNGKVNNSDEFLKGGILLKTIRIEENGSIKENMSFPSFKFMDIINQDWEETDFRNTLINHKFVFAIFKKHKAEYVFKGIKFWNVPESIVDVEGKEVFEKLKKTILEGNIVREIKFNKSGKEIRKTNFPGQSYNKYFHVRPHGINSNDVDVLPIPDKKTKSNLYTKQCFWINQSYIRDVLKDYF